MKSYFSKVFGDLLNKIQNDNIREKTVDVWVLAAKEGGWENVSDIEKMPFTLLTNTHGVSLIEHTIAVTKAAVAIADAITSTYKLPFEINYDYLYSGGLLHDVGKLLETEFKDGVYLKSEKGKCTRHPISGTVLAAKVGMPYEIQNIIACHAKEGEGAPKRIETILIHQADFATFDPMVMFNNKTLIV